MSAKTPEHIRRRIVELRRQGFTGRQIGDAMGLTEGQVHNIWRTPEQLQRNAMWRKQRRRSKRQRDVGQGWQSWRDWHDPRDVPPEVIADRDRRIEGELTANMAVLGDPITPRWMSNR